MSTTGVAETMTFTSLDQCAVCGRNGLLKTGEHVCPRKTLRRLDSAERRYNDEPTEPENLTEDERLDLGFAMLAGEVV